MLTRRLLRILPLLFGAAAAIAFLPACTTSQLGGGSSSNYRVTAYRPQNPDNVRVKLSTSTQNLYVMEGDRCLMAVQSNVGKTGSPTPLGQYRIYHKDKTRRRRSQPDAGYPMAYWCEFKPAYGFHEGFVHPAPRTHGCVRLHREAAARFFALVKIGTPVNIAVTQPEDATFGKNVTPLDQSADPDPPRSLMFSSEWFKDPTGPLLVDR